MTDHGAPDASSDRSARSQHRPGSPVQAPSMTELLAAGAAATAVSTPPRAPEPAAEPRPAPPRDGDRDAA